MLVVSWVLKWVRLMAWLFALAVLFLIFFYSPFYSKLIVRGLKTWVPVQVNQVAAQSQQRAQLTEHDSLEPGSNLWIARQAYLKLMEQVLQAQQAAASAAQAQNNNASTVASGEQITPTSANQEQHLVKSHGGEQNGTENKHQNTQVQADTISGSVQNNLTEPQQLLRIQARYQILQQRILDQQQQEFEQRENKVPFKVQKNRDDAASVPDSAEIAALLDNQQSSNQALLERYTQFLSSYPVKLEKIDSSQSEQHLAEDLALLKQLQQQPAVSTSKPYAILVLGGGLTLDDQKQKIVVNQYTRLRLQTALSLQRIYPLPIVLSGVEAPYMQKWLKTRGVDAKLLEDRSMNTCENSRFSSLLLQKKGGAPTVLLVTDIYHMPRTRRLFALNGIETIPVIAPMPTQLTQWQPSLKNYDHSRRANYELLATLRDMLVGSSDCREVP